MVGFGNSSQGLPDVCLYDMQTAGAYKDSYVGRVNWIDS